MKIGQEFTDPTSSRHRHLPDRRETRSTSTIAGDGRLVPWLAAEGRLAYRPEQPPERDYYFQYGWVLPEIFAVRRVDAHDDRFAAEQAACLHAKARCGHDGRKE